MNIISSKSFVTIIIIIIIIIIISSSSSSSSIINNNNNINNNITITIKSSLKLTHVQEDAVLKKIMLIAHPQGVLR
jgi:hypothetical protein